MIGPVNVLVRYELLSRSAFILQLIVIISLDMSCLSPYREMPYVTGKITEQGTISGYRTLDSGIILLFHVSFRKFEYD